MQKDISHYLNKILTKYKKKYFLIDSSKLLFYKQFLNVLTFGYLLQVTIVGKNSTL